MTYTRCLWGCFFVFMCIGLAAVCKAKGGGAHITDIREIIFHSTKDPNAQKLCSFISQGMDMGSDGKPLDLAEAGSSFWKTLKHESPSLPGNLGQHRMYGHWGLNSPIPKESLEFFEKKCPGSAEKAIKLWRQFVLTRREAVKQVLQLSGPNSDRAAQAIASLMSDVHILGDYTTKNIHDLPTVDNIVKDYKRAVNRLFGNNNNFTKLIGNEIDNIPKGLSEKEKAEEILKILKNRSGDFFSRLEGNLRRMGYTGNLAGINHAKLKRLTASLVQMSDVAEATGLQLMQKLRQYFLKSKSISLYGKLKDSYDGKINTASRRIAERASRTFDRVYSPEALKNLKNVTSQRVVVGALQEITTKDGTQNLVLSIPIENVAKGIKSGIGAGVMTFVISEGVTLYQFSRGDITQDQFYWDTAKNASAAMLTGTGTFVAVVLGATPTGWVVMAVGTGAYMLCDITFPKLQQMVEGPTFTLDDILGELPTEIQRRSSFYDYSGYETLLDYDGEGSILDYYGNESVFEFSEGDSLFDFESHEESVLDF